MGHRAIPRAYTEKLEKNHRIKVLLIDNSVQHTGAYHSILCFIRELHEKVAFYFAVPNGCWTNNPDIPQDRLQIFRFIELNKSLKVIWYLPRLIINLVKIRGLTRRWDIDVVHVNDLYNMLGVCLKIVKPSIRVVYHVRLRKGSYVGPMYNTWIRLIVRFADAIVPVSNCVKNELRIKSEKVTRIYDAVDSSWESVPPVSFDRQQDLRFLYVANFIPGKGQDFALKAFELVKQKNITLRFVGATGKSGKNRAYLESLKRYVVNKKLEARVSFTEYQIDMADQLAWAHVALNFSESESFSMVCLEALASGRPVIATRCGGPEEIIRDDENGFLVENRDIASMAQRVSHLAEHPDLVLELSSNAKVDLMEKFGIELLSGKLYQVYES